jgi:glycosyltransferase involved in cell wall biosynthesis
MVDLMDSLLAQAGIEIPVLLFNDGPLVGELERRGLPVRVLPLPPPLLHLGEGLVGGGLRGTLQVLPRLVLAGLALVGFLPRLRRAVAALRPDIVHSNGIKAHLLLCLAGLSAPLVWHIRDFVGLRPLMARLLRYASRRARGAITVSKAVGEDATRVLGDRFPVWPIYDGINVGQFADVRNGKGPQARVRVGLIGTFARWKGHSVFLQAASKLVHERKRSDVRFLIVGGPIYDTLGSQFTVEELTAMAATLNLTSHVEFVPFQPDVTEAYRRVDVVVHASVNPEPFGRTIVEGMACGLAVVAMRAGGAAELFTDGVDAVGAGPGSVDEMAAAIERLLDDEGLRRRLGENGQRTVRERFDLSRLASEVLKFYAEVAPKI